jgi:transketolase
VLFDDNKISIDGPTSLSVSDDQLARFKASGWNVDACNGHDPADVERAIAAAQKSDRPTLIACRTTIGYGAPKKAGTAATHGAPLGADEIAGAREVLGWPHAPFDLPDPVLATWRAAGQRGRHAYQAWSKRHDSHPDRGEFDRRLAGDLPEGFASTVNELKRAAAAEAPKLATRMSSQKVLEALTPLMPELVGGSADLTGSNNTRTKDTTPLTADDFAGRYVHYGVREHGMAAAMNGLALHGGLVPYGGTFLVFTDYCRPSIRLSALMGQRVVYVMTHDSIGLGEDGPTHQPVEHLASLRAIPNLLVFRPADTVETAECWAAALSSAGRPSVLALTRQALPTVRRSHADENLCARGGYILVPAEGSRRVTLIASGSEVAIALEARDKLQADGIGAAVVSLPCWELFEAQTPAYRHAVLGPGAVRVAIEAASPFGWERHVGAGGAVIGMTGFGASAPAEDLYRHFGITAEAAVVAAKARL